MAIEQLRYTWAPRGLSGVSQFQVVGTSAGFSDQASREWAWAIELCTFPGLARGEAAVHWPSVGWVTLRDGRRIVFHRVDAGVDGAGRRGNFAAHILIGSREELPIALGALLLQGAFWWKGVPHDEPRLPILALDPAWRVIQVSDVHDTDLSTALAALLESSGTVSGFARNPAIAAHALGVLCDVAPQLLEERSISTYESSSNAANFQIVGVVAGRPVERSPSAAARSVAAYLLQLPTADRAERRGMLARSGANWDSIVVALWPFALRAAGEAFTWEQMAPLSGRLEAAADLCDFPEGRAALCAGILDGSAQALALLEGLLTNAHPDLIRQLAHDAALAAAPAARHDVMGVIDRSGHLARQGAADAVRELTASSPPFDITGSLPLGVLADLLANRPEPHLPPRSEWVARATTLVRTAHRIPEFEDAWPPVLVALADQGAWAVVGAVLAKSRSAASAAVVTLPPEAWAHIFAALNSQNLITVAGNVRASGLSRRLWPDAFWAAVRTVGNEAGWTLLADLRLPVPLPAVHDETVAEDFMKWRAKYELVQPSSKMLLAQSASLLTDSRSDHLLAWGLLATSNADTARQTDSAWHLPLGPALQTHALWAVLRRLTTHRTPQVLSTWAHQMLLDAAASTASKARVLDSITERCLMGSNPAGVAAAVLTFAHLIDSGEVSVNRLTGRLKDQDVDARWRQATAAAALSDGDLQGFTAGSFSRATNSWLRSVVPRNRDPSPAHRRDDKATGRWGGT